MKHLLQLTLIQCPIFKLKYIVTFWYFGVLRRIVEWLNKHSAVISTPAKGKATSYRRKKSKQVEFAKECPKLTISTFSSSFYLESYNFSASQRQGKFIQEKPWRMKSKQVALAKKYPYRHMDNFFNFAKASYLWGFSFHKFIGKTNTNR